MKSARLILGMSEKVTRELRGWMLNVIYADFKSNFDETRMSLFGEMLGGFLFSFSGITRRLYD